jgi:hypothetical protein
MCLPRWPSEPRSSPSVAGAANPNIGAKITECTKISICYCVNGDPKDVIDAKVARFRGVSPPRHIEKRFGDGQVRILNPGVPEANIANGSGADYMPMWTQVLEGREGLGEDFDFVYFVGPQDFARYLALDGNADLQKYRTVLR